MIGLVAVSHSRPLAEAAVGLARQMVAGVPVRIEIAAGVEAEEGVILGTNATAISEAIQKADDGSGVVVLMDLGSAVMSSSMALELLDEDQAATVMLSVGPFVEGLVIGAVAAAAGSALADVAAQADAALLVKRGQR